jgi:hypothetical protein
MKSCTNTVSSLLAATCAILFAIATALSLPANIVERSLFEAGAYKQALVDQHTYARMPALIAEQIIYTLEQPATAETLNPGLKRLTRADWELILSDLLTEADLQFWAESLIDTFIEYVNPHHNLVEVSYSLNDFKKKLDSEAGYRAALHMISTQPACTSDEWAQIVNQVQSAQFENLPFCRPPAEVLAVAEPYIREALHSLSAAIPYELTYDFSSPSSPVEVEPWHARLLLVQTMIKVSLCLPLLLLVLTALFGVRSLASGGLWLGLPLACAGLLTLLTAQITRLLPGWLIAQAFPSGAVTIQGVAPGVTQELVDLVTSVTHAAARSINFTGVVLAVLGAGLLAAGFLLGLARR